MSLKRIIRPDRLRQVPKPFNWVDHRLVRDRHICRCGHADWTLYLFLVTVGDYQGLSYDSDRSIQPFFSMDHATLDMARQSLILADLIAFDAPLYPVLSLETNRVVASCRANIKDNKEPSDNYPGPEAMSAILARLMEAVS